MNSFFCALYLYLDGRSPPSSIHVLAHAAVCMLQENPMLDYGKELEHINMRNIYSLSMHLI
jgi:hypothetical protein